MRRSNLFWLWVGVVFCLALFLSYIWYVRSRADHWMPTTPEPLAKTIFEARWGDGESELGFYKASDKEGDIFNDGFQNFYVNGNSIYIADPIKKQITVFEHNKLNSRYQYTLGSVQGLAVMSEFMYILDGRGYISKIYIQTGKYKMSKLAVVENEYGYIPENMYALYILNNEIVLNTGEKNICVSAENLSIVNCPFKQKEYIAGYSDIVYLPEENYAILTGYDIWLYNRENKKMGVIKKLPWDSLLYTVRSGIQVTMDGVYYVEHSDAGAKIYFKPWQR